MAAAFPQSKKVQWHKTFLNEVGNFLQIETRVYPTRARHLANLPAAAAQAESHNAAQAENPYTLEAESLYQALDEDDLRGLRKVTRTWLSWFHLFAHAASLLGTAWAGMTVLQSSVGPFTKVILYIAAFFLIGSRMRALGNMIHECSHNSLFAERKWNRVVGELLCVFDFQSFATYVKEHLSHHRYVGNKTMDLDFSKRQCLLEVPESGLKNFSFARKVFKLRFYRVYLTVCLWNRKEKNWLKIARVLNFLLHAMFIWLTSFPSWMLFLVIPYALSYQWFKFFSDVTDHAGLMNATHQEMRARNHVFQSKLLNIFILPRTDGFHLVHHLYPFIPTWNLKRTHDLLLAQASYRNRPHFFFQIFKLPAAKAFDSQKYQES